MEDIFISHIHINQVRHLKNLDIPLSATERQHLILTGANGSGKTSFLLELKEYLKEIENGSLSTQSLHKKEVLMLQINLNEIEKQLSNSSLTDKNTREQLNVLKKEQKRLLLLKIKTEGKLVKSDATSTHTLHRKDILTVQKKLHEIEQKLLNLYKQSVKTEDKLNLLNKEKKQLLLSIKSKERSLKQFENLNVSVVNLGLAPKAFQDNNFILAFFNSKRISEFSKSKGPQKIELQNFYKLEEKANKSFIQYIVNLRYDKLDAKDTNNSKEAKAIDEWFEKFTNALKNIFEDDTLTLEFDRPNYNYNIILRGREKFDLNTLSDGYSAVMNILTELILRMEKKRGRFYDIQGIVLIDEIETHLHIDLQKKILPFLTAFFPKIQFIVTTHSPFVLTSLSNAVVYDLENQQPIHDLSGYSVEAIIEAYFGQDKYASILTEKVNRYERLMSRNGGLSEAEKEEKSDLKGYFKNLPYFLAPELQVKIQQIELAQLGK